MSDEASSETPPDIASMDTGEILSGAVIHNGTVHLAGLTSDPPHAKSVTQQTREILRSIDDYLARAGTSKTRLLTANIWLVDMDDFDEMNRQWIAWIPKGATPARACVEARLPGAGYKVEIMVTAAL